MKMKKFIAVLATVSMVAAMAAGCGSSSDDTSAEGDAAATTLYVYLLVRKLGCGKYDHSCNT